MAQGPSPPPGCAWGPIDRPDLLRGSRLCQKEEASGRAGMAGEGGAAGEHWARPRGAPGQGCGLGGPGPAGLVTGLAWSGGEYDKAQEGRAGRARPCT